MPELAESQQFCLCCPTQGELNLRMNSSVTFNILFEPERKPSITILPNIVNLLLIWDLDFLTGGTWSSLTRGNQLVIFNSIHRYFFEKPQHWVCKRHKSSCWHKTPWKRYFRPLASFYQFLPQRQKWSLRCWRPAEWTKWDTFLRVPLSPLDRPAAKFLAFAKKKDCNNFPRWSPWISTRLRPRDSSQFQWIVLPPDSSLKGWWSWCFGCLFSSFIGGFSKYQREKHLLKSVLYIFNSGSKLEQLRTRF